MSLANVLLLVRDLQQLHGAEFRETFPHVLKFSCIPLVLSLVAQYNLEL